jgi:aryl-alcohol dehydrogenase
VRAEAAVDVRSADGPPVLEGAFKSLSLRGTIASVGAPPVGATVSIDVFSLLIRGITYVGSCAGDANYRVSIPALVELYKRGRFPLDQLVQTFGFDEMEEALAAMKAGRCAPFSCWSCWR